MVFGVRTQTERDRASEKEVRGSQGARNLNLGGERERRVSKRESERRREGVREWARECGANERASELASERGMQGGRNVGARRGRGKGWSEGTQSNFGMEFSRPRPAFQLESIQLHSPTCSSPVIPHSRESESLIRVVTPNSPPSDDTSPSPTHGATPR
jgi:hypothetical protein